MSNLTDGLTLIGWRLKRDAEIRGKQTSFFSLSHSHFDFYSLARKNDVNFECEVEPSSTSYACSRSPDDLCLEVESIDLTDHEVHRYNFADDDTPVKYPLAIGSRKVPRRTNDQDNDVAPIVEDIADEYLPSKKRLKTSSNLDEQLISKFEFENKVQLGELRVYAPKLRLRLSTVNVNWLRLPPIPRFANKIHRFSS